MFAIERHWQTHTWASRLLSPLAVLYGAIVSLNRRLFRAGWRRVHRIPVPVVVVGNITVGGTGKTPLTIWIARELKRRGWRPGIVTRGYGGRARSWPQWVTVDSDPALVGDEAVVLARRAGVPVVADPDRARAAARLLPEQCNVIVSDDGLQHYRLARDVEIAVIDGERRFGNGYLLPAGPLRELPSRLEETDARVVHGNGGSGEWSLHLRPIAFHRVDGAEETLPVEAFRGRAAHAVAGIGHPARFFKSLRDLDIQIIEHRYPDHHRFNPGDLHFSDTRDVIMTEKDAVKCRRFAEKRWWYLAVEADVSAGFGDWLQQRLENIPRG